MGEALRLEGVYKCYRTSGEVVVALRGVSLSLREGELACVMGPSGSGKTTLLKVSAGLLEPDRGSVRLLGRELYRLPLGERLRLRCGLVGFMFQEDLLIDTLTVLENVELPLLARGVPRRRRRELALEALERLGIRGLAQRKPREVSGGERRRVSLAMSIVGEPKVLFADEPTSNLDTETSLAILGQLKELNKEGMTILMATHDPLVAEEAGNVIFLRDGRVVGRRAGALGQGPPPQT